MHCRSSLCLTELLALATVLSAGMPLAKAADAEKPNVVILFADDLGYGDVSCFGYGEHQGKYKTPHLDRMAAEGVRLTNFYVPMPYCAPSRATILTGRYPFRHGLTRNPCPDASPEADVLGLSPSEITLAEALSLAITRATAQTQALTVTEGLTVAPVSDPALSTSQAITLGETLSLALSTGLVRKR